MIEKSKTSGADRLYFDLEDSVPYDEKVNARRIVADAIPSFRDEQVQVYVRVNDLTTGMTSADLDAIVQLGLDGIVLPKTEDADTVVIADYLLTTAEKTKGLPAGEIAISASLETARGIANCREIMTASHRVTTVACGVAEDGDLQKDLGCAWSPEGTELLYAMSRLIVEGRAAGITCLEVGPYVKHEDDAGLERDARFARRLGYTSKCAIHPRQVPIINRAFSYSDEEVAYYRRVVAAMEDALAHGLAAVTVDGRMVDVAMLKRGRSVVALADAQRAREQAAPAEARS